MKREFALLLLAWLLCLGGTAWAMLA